jgi:hypothetical protein
MVEKSFALLVAAVCLVLLVRLFMPERYRWRLDSAAQGAWRGLVVWSRGVWRWRSSRKEAARLAEEAIRRARNGVERDGNVLRPKSFGQPPGSRESRDSGEPRKPH